MKNFKERVYSIIGKVTAYVLTGALILSTADVLLGKNFGASIAHYFKPRVSDSEKPLPEPTVTPTVLPTSEVVADVTAEPVVTPTVTEAPIATTIPAQTTSPISNQPMLVESPTTRDQLTSLANTYYEDFYNMYNTHPYVEISKSKALSVILGINGVNPNNVGVYTENPAMDIENAFMSWWDTIMREPIEYLWEEGHRESSRPDSINWEVFKEPFASFLVNELDRKAYNDLAIPLLEIRRLTEKGRFKEATQMATDLFIFYARCYIFNDTPNGYDPESLSPAGEHLCDILGIMISRLSREDTPFVIPTRVGSYRVINFSKRVSMDEYKRMTSDKSLGNRDLVRIIDLEVQRNHTLSSVVVITALTDGFGNCTPEEVENAARELEKNKSSLIEFGYNIASGDIPIIYLPETDEIVDEKKLTRHC